MHIYKKKTKANKAKQFAKRLLFQALALAGGLFLLNAGIDHIQRMPSIWSVKHIVIINAEAQGIEAEAPLDALAYIEAQEAGTIESKIKKTFPENPAVMLAIAKAESGLDPNAMHQNKDGSTDTGIMQVNSIHGYDIQKLKIPPIIWKPREKFMIDKGSRHGVLTITEII